MKKTYIFSGYLIVFSVIILVFTGFRSDKNFRLLKSNEPIIDMYLDSIPAGPITQKQLLSVTKLVVISDGVSYGIKSFDIILMPHAGGPSHIVHCFGAALPKNALDVFHLASDKDYIAAANIKLFNLEKFRQDPHAKPFWTVISDK